MTENGAAPGRRACGLRWDRRRFLTVGAAVPLAVTLASCAGEDAAAPTGTAGPDLTGVDPAVRPQDDLFRHVNGGWLRDYRLPPDKASHGTFEELADRTEDRLREILEAADDAGPGTDARRLRDLYRAYLDTAAIEAAGTRPLADLLGEIDAAATKSDLARVAGALHALEVTGPVWLRVEPDRKDSTRHRPYLVQSGLGMPDEAYYREPVHSELRTAYRGYLTRIATAAGLPDPAGVAERVFDLETRLAAGHVDMVRWVDSLSSYHPWSWTELRDRAPGFDWDAWLDGLGGQRARFETVLVDQPEYPAALARLWEAEDAGRWREYLRLRLFDHYAPVLPAAFADAHFDWAERAQTGTKQPPPRWRAAVRFVRTKMGDALGREYAQRHFPAESKRQVEQLVEDLLAAYRQRLAEADWMSEQTRRTALAKVDKIVALIGYPDTWRDYSGLVVRPGELLASLRAVENHEFRHRLGRLDRPVDRREWTMLTPVEVNANYSWEINHIVFPAAILQPPFFDPAAAPAVNYGAIGVVIGHEIGHGFDTGGSRYDENGTLRDWWTSADKAAFEAKTKAVIAQYDPLVPAGMPPDRRVNGALTVTENLADIRGVSTALAAYRIAAARAGAAEPDWRALFLSYARIWRHTATPEYTAATLGLDSHAPAEFRVNQVVRNMAEFHTAFEVRPGDGMYLAEHDRVRL
ncbi:M13 family metallopeptidase [Nocardia farcinica]|uniref:M13 family metallopeptidase n=1 Tax=Nocardia farcinica TaxID=37329 RepID=UPI00189451FB|nr:M13 family metallopeptidase [Nocardia farcinica]MBF6522990.1 M13 family metallopeptidase [Nocardia farcinica]